VSLIDVPLINVPLIDVSLIDVSLIDVLLIDVQHTSPIDVRLARRDYCTYDMMLSCSMNLYIYIYI
jgi:hypothetical protein